MGTLGNSPKAVKLADDVRVRVEQMLERKEPSAGLAEVSLYFDIEFGIQPSKHIVTESDLMTFLAATLELHYEPGLNPHHHFETSPVQVITVAILRPTGPYWWATPGLQDKHDDQGAVTFNWDPCPRIVWLRPGVELPEFLQASVY